MEWVRNHIILKTENFGYRIRGNEKSVRPAGDEITLQAKTMEKRAAQSSRAFKRSPLRKF